MSFHVLDAIKKTKAQGFSSVKFNDLIMVTHLFLVYMLMVFLLVNIMEENLRVI
jgi:hypothetical protein